MPMYNLIDYSDNYSDTSGSLWQFKRDEIINHADVTNYNNAPSFKYKASIIDDTEKNGTKNGVKIVVPLKYLSNIWRSLEIPLINCKIELSLKWYKRCLLTVDNTTTFKTTDAKLYVPIVTLSVEDNSTLSKLLNEGFKRPIYWNQYKITPNKIVKIVAVNEENTYENYLIQVVKELKDYLFLLMMIQKVIIKFLLIHKKKYFFSRVKIENYNIEIEGRNFYDQPINDSIKQYDEIRKISTGQGDDYTTGCLLDFAYFEKNYRLIAADLSKQKASDVDSRAVQQIIFTGKIKATVADTKVRMFYVLEKSNETILEFSKGTTKVL